VQPLTNAQWTKLFADCQHSACHLEMRDSYGVDAERERFERFLSGGSRDDDAEAEERRHWLDLIRAATQAGVQVRRARIISEPVTDYIRFEYAGTDLNVKAGEEVRWLPRRLTSGIPLPGNDFWLFDETSALFNLFAGDGQSVGHEITDNPDVVQLCKSAFEAVWTVAIPHAHYKPA
jgi:hypothetical protein